MTLILLWHCLFYEVTCGVIPHTLLDRIVYFLGIVYLGAPQLNNESIAEVVLRYSIVLIHSYEGSLGSSRSHAAFRIPDKASLFFRLFLISTKKVCWFPYLAGRDDEVFANFPVKPRTVSELWFRIRPLAVSMCARQLPILLYFFQKPSDGSMLALLLEVCAVA